MSEDGFNGFIKHQIYERIKPAAHRHVMPGEEGGLHPGDAKAMALHKAPQIKQSNTVMEALSPTPKPTTEPAELQPPTPPSTPKAE